MCKSQYCIHKISSKFINLFPRLLHGNKILTSIKGHNLVEKNMKNNVNCSYLHFVNINAFTKFYQNPSIGPQDIAHKRNFDIIQWP